MKLTFIGHRINIERESIVDLVLGNKKENTRKVSR
jgi:hypothetical protein